MRHIIIIFLLIIPITSYCLTLNLVGNSVHITTKQNITTVIKNTNLLISDIENIIGIQIIKDFNVQTYGHVMDVCFWAHDNSEHFYQINEGSIISYANINFKKNELLSSVPQTLNKIDNAFPKSCDQEEFYSDYDLHRQNIKVRHKQKTTRHKFMFVCSLCHHKRNAKTRFLSGDELICWGCHVEKINRYRIYE